MDDKSYYVITGGSGGVGSCLASRLGKHAPVITVDLDGSTISADLADPQQTQQVMQDIVQRTGSQIRGLICCHGISPQNTDHHRTVAVNYTSVRDLIIGFAGIMPRGSSAVILTSTAATYDTYDDLAWRLAQEQTLDIPQQLSIEQQEYVCYMASKRALYFTVKSHSQHWARSGLRINAVALGGVDTSMLRQALKNPSYRDFWPKLNPMQRLGRPEEVCAAIEFLLSEEASFINGHQLVVDGGSRVSDSSMQS